jgi:hypothetical protein
MAYDNSERQREARRVIGEGLQAVQEHLERVQLALREALANMNDAKHVHQSVDKIVQLMPDPVTLMLLHLASQTYEELQISNFGGDPRNS